MKMEKHNIEKKGLEEVMENKANDSGEKGADESDKNASKKPEKRGNKMKIIVVAIIAIAISGGLFLLFQKQQAPQNPYQLSFANETLNFRANLEKAARISVIPDEQSIRNAILSENTSRIKISYVPGEQNPFYAAASFEIAYKLVIIFKHYYGINGYLYAGENGESCIFFEETGKNVCILSEPVLSADDVSAGDAERAIFLTDANETSVSLNNSIIYIKGKDFSEKDRKYTDLDLAADKFLLTLMGK